MVFFEFCLGAGQFVGKLHDSKVRICKESGCYISLAFQVVNGFPCVSILPPLLKTLLAIREWALALMGFNPFLDRQHKKGEACFAQSTRVAAGLLGNVVLADWRSPR